MPVGAIATKGVLGDAGAAGYRERRGMADGGAPVPEVLSAAELEGFFAGFVTEPLEPALGASMGEDVEEAQDDDDDDVYYPKGRRPREDEEGEESYEKQRQRPGRGG